MVAEERKIRRSDLPPEAQELLRQIEVRAHQAENAVRVWNDHFSTAERKELGDEPFQAWKHNGGTAGMWAVAKEVSRERALVDIAYALDWLETAKCEWLLEVIGEKTATVIKPRWNSATGELWFDGELVRKVANMAKAKNVVAILNACEENGWPKTFADPLTGGGDNYTRRRTVESLNKGLTRIRFVCSGDGETFGWEVRSRENARTSAGKPRRKKPT
jgi:hypothetical protein